MNKIITNTLQLIFTICCCIPLNGQDLVEVDSDTFAPQKQFSFKTLTINDGLSQNSVISIAQDSIGYLWMATQDGLNKYNGRDFKHYDKQFEDITRATFSKLGKVYIDKQNRLWIITHSGKLELYQPQTDDFKHIKFKFDVSTIFQDKYQNLYIGTFNNGLFKVNSGTKDTIQVLKDTDKSKTVYHLMEDDNTLIAACSESVLSIYENRDYNTIPVQNSVTTNYSSLEKGPDKTLWLGTYGHGLFYKPQGSKSFIKYENKNIPPDLNIEDLLIDSKSRLWIATYGNGVYLIDKKSNIVKNFKANKNNPFAIHYNDMLSLYEDITGTIWFGSDGTGASYYDAHLIKFNILTNNQVPKSVNVDMVRCITTDKQNNIWIGTSGKGLTVVDLKKETYKTYTTENSYIASNRIISTCFLNDELWIGHQGYGLNILEASGNYKYYPELKNHTIWRIIKVSNQQAWLCTERHGIILFDKYKGILKTYNTNNSKLSSNNIRALVYGIDNDMWIGTDDNGLFKLNETTNQIEKINNINDKIKSLYYSKNTLWVGTNGNGLKAYNIEKDTIETFTTKNGLPNDVVYGILPDNENNLWLSTNNGISKFNHINFENFSVYDGLQAKEFNTGAYYKDQYNTLYFGGLEGINWFHPEQLSFNKEKPKTIISKFEVFSKPRDLTPNLNLNYKDNTITFSFSSLHFSQPKRNLYKYQLVNHDNDWIESGNNNTAHYTNLPPNNYTFQVISCNYDGIWNNTPTTYAFTIRQPWYFSTMAIVLYLLLFLIISYLVYSYLKWRWHIKMQLQFEHEETERLKQLDSFKTKLYTNISHEFRTPLTLISGPVEKQLNNPKLSNTDRKELKLVQRNSKRLLNLVNQLLDLSKLETGNLTLSVVQGDLGLFLTQLVKSFQFKAEEKNIDFRYNIPKIQEAWFDKDVVEKIVTNLLANAVKYAPNNGKVSFQVNKQQGEIIITIINNGNTIPDDNISKLFQRYYQDNKSADGVGIGLSLVKELTVLSHGNIVAHTLNKDDIQFTVTLPIEQSFFNPNEITEISIPNTADNTKQEQSENVIAHKEQPLMLIVEDDEDIRIFLNSIFREDYIIEESENGDIGIKKAVKLIPDIIISDVMMPKTDGIILCNTLKHDERTSHIPIILLTAKSGTSNEIEGLKTGADDYIEKPFHTEKLKIKIQNLIESRRKLQQRYNQNFKLTEIAVTSTEQQFFNKVKEVLDQNITDSQFNSADFSKKMLMSRMQLHRKLKALTGLTTTEFIRSERLKLAEKLLKSSDLTVSEIAFQVGFNTPSYFIKCFKEQYKKTPTEYHSK
ncbi:two-component regulator propeller domain-containing protein [Aestuariibaculum sp. YM273]|uniref:hybrid sensor histidine kinase/response regulator transcription factor n=1 Tax=Aestuariibaculum sp. YM273 TaxID=3070659 RepID=UPI0027DDE3AF|nr:hybrid sensor histidine kinase/response regulator transcription factor [Aestuariibaculum sp. YM273]WMI65587.1 two-component regulator propeller domain-containing protein [Aestuariibaculum sp. YM273]